MSAPGATGAPAPRPPPLRHRAARLFRVASAGDGLALLGSLVLVLGGALITTAGHPDQAGQLGPVIAVLGALLFLQACSSASPLGKFLLAGATAVGGAAVAANLWVLEPGGLGSLPAAGVALTLLGAVLSLGGAELLRHEAGATYLGLARRGTQLVQEPAFHRAALLFFIPWALVGFVVLLILELGPEIAGKFAAIFVQYFFNPVGKEVAIYCGIHECAPLIPGPPLHPLEVGPFLVFVDAVTALFLAWNYRYLLGVAFLGDLLRWVEEHGRKTVAKRPWIRRLAFFGVMLYAALPFEGTGAIGGTIVGRTVGLDAARTWGAVVCGSIIRTAVSMAAIVLGVQVFGVAQERGLALPLGLAFAAVVFLIVMLVMRRRRRRARRGSGTGSDTGP